MELKKYEIWCNDEEAYIITDYKEELPTTCPHNNTHSVDTDKTHELGICNDAKVVYPRGGDIRSFSQTWTENLTPFELIPEVDKKLMILKTEVTINTKVIVNGNHFVYEVWQLVPDGVGGYVSKIVSQTYYLTIGEILQQCDRIVPTNDIIKAFFDWADQDDISRDPTCLHSNVGNKLRIYLTPDIKHIGVGSDPLNEYEWLLGQESTEVKIYHPYALSTINPIWPESPEISEVLKSAGFCVHCVSFNENVILK